MPTTYENIVKLMAQGLRNAVSESAHGRGLDPVLFATGAFATLTPPEQDEVRRKYPIIYSALIQPYGPNARQAVGGTKRTELLYEIERVLGG